MISVIRGTRRNCYISLSLYIELFLCYSPMCWFKRSCKGHYFVCNGVLRIINGLPGQLFPMFFYIHFLIKWIWARAPSFHDFVCSSLRFLSICQLKSSQALLLSQLYRDIQRYSQQPKLNADLCLNLVYVFSFWVYFTLWEVGLMRFEYLFMKGYCFFLSCCSGNWKCIFLFQMSPIFWQCSFTALLHVENRGKK